MAEAGMMGKKTFSPADADRVRELLRQVRAVDRDTQKGLCERLRTEIGFYISDFMRSSGNFLGADFELLIRPGTIRIV